MTEFHPECGNGNWLQCVHMFNCPANSFEALEIIFCNTVLIVVFFYDKVDGDLHQDRTTQVLMERYYIRPFHCKSELIRI